VIKLQMPQDVESAPIMKPKVGAVIVQLVGLFTVEVEGVGFPAKVLERSGEVPGVVVALTYIEDTTRRHFDLTLWHS
jgi:hypothetical protein